MGNFLSKNIKYLREQMGYTQENLANALTDKLSLATIKRYEKGINVPKLETLLQLANLFGVSVENLITHNFESAEPPYPGVRFPVVNKENFCFFEGQKYYVYYLSEKTDEKYKRGLLCFDSEHDKRRNYLHGSLKMHRSYDCKLVIDGKTVLIYGIGKKYPQRIIITLFFPDFGEEKEFTYKGGIGVLVHQDTHDNQAAQRICLSFKEIQDTDEEAKKELFRVLTENGNLNRITVNREVDSLFSQWLLKSNKNENNNEVRE